MTKRGRRTLEKNKNKGINVFQKYLSLWVLFCMIVGVLIGKYIPIIPAALGKMQIAGISVPIAIFGIDSPVAVACTVGVLTEVPVMLFLVNIANNTKHWFLENKESKVYGG